MCGYVYGVSPFVMVRKRRASKTTPENNGKSDNKKRRAGKKSIEKVTESEKKLKVSWK